MAEIHFHVINIGALSMNPFWGETERLRQPHATCSLLITPEARIITDPGRNPEDMVRLLFERSGLRPGQVDVVFVTHHHGDHLRGMCAFEKATWMTPAGELKELQAEGFDLAPKMEAAPETLVSGVRLLATPGHTPHHCALQVELAAGTLLVAGDAAITREHFDRREPFHRSWDAEQARQTLLMIAEKADFVIPGHGNYFVNERQ